MLDFMYTSAYLWYRLQNCVRINLRDTEFRNGALFFLANWKYYDRAINISGICQSIQILIIFNSPIHIDKKQELNAGIRINCWQ